MGSLIEIEEPVITERGTAPELLILLKTLNLESKISICHEILVSISVLLPLVHSYSLRCRMSLQHELIQIFFFLKFIFWAHLGWPSILNLDAFSPPERVCNRNLYFACAVVGWSVPHWNVGGHWGVPSKGIFAVYYVQIVIDVMSLRFRCNIFEAGHLREDGSIPWPISLLLNLLVQTRIPGTFRTPYLTYHHLSKAHPSSQGKLALALWPR